jgi:hypothetical protein
VFDRQPNLYSSSIGNSGGDVSTGWMRIALGGFVVLVIGLAAILYFQGDDVDGANVRRQGPNVLRLGVPRQAELQSNPSRVGGGGTKGPVLLYEIRNTATSEQLTKNTRR